LDEEYIHQGTITNEVISKWAYDENMLLLEQDEDLVAGDREFFPALFDAIEDPTCPKGDYILSILDFYLMFQILKGGPEAINVVEEAISYCNKSTIHKVHKLKELLESRIRFKKGVGKVDKVIALEMGQILLNGICRSADISVVNDTKNTWVVELSVPPMHRHKERIFINKETGNFEFKVSYSGGWL